MKNWKRFLQTDKSKQWMFGAVATVFVAAAILSICCGVVNLTIVQLVTAVLEGAGILLSFIGGPFCVFLLLKNRGGHRYG